MAKKDVEKIYRDISDQYLEMANNVKEMEEALEKEIVSPERVEALKKQVEGIKTSYQLISNFMYELNKPNDSKLFIWFDTLLDKLGIKTKTNQLRKRFSHEHTLEGIKEKNQEAIDNLKL